MKKLRSATDGEPLPYEIPCIGIQIRCDPNIIEKALKKDEANLKDIDDYVINIIEPARRANSFICMNGTPAGFLTLLRRDPSGDTTEAEALLAEYRRLGFEASLASEVVYADGRYLNVKKYKGLHAPLPPYEMEQGIVKLLDELCLDWHVEQNPRIASMCYIGDLGGKKYVVIGVFNSNEELSAGIAGETIYMAKGEADVESRWKGILDCVRGDAEDWLKTKPSEGVRAQA